MDIESSMGLSRVFASTLLRVAGVGENGVLASLNRFVGGKFGSSLVTASEAGGAVKPRFGH